MFVKLFTLVFVTTFKAEKRRAEVLVLVSAVLGLRRLGSNGFNYVVPHYAIKIKYF